MAVVISLGIAVLVVAFVAAPFFLLSGRSSEPAPKDPEAPDVLRDLLAEKETIYATIQELDFDFKSGKLSVEDHQDLRRRQETHAAAVLRRIDELQQTAGPTDGPGGSRREKRKA
ncbi:MAG: hypothetical protein HY713_00805 [candidate division NC10 bacterium]|nr:hypothetical protein [candidate division NC10 bacterium]